MIVRDVRPRIMSSPKIISTHAEMLFVKITKGTSVFLRREIKESPLLMIPTLFEITSSNLLSNTSGSMEIWAARFSTKVL